MFKLSSRKRNVSSSGPARATKPQTARNLASSSKDVSSPA